VYDDASKSLKTVARGNLRDRIGRAIDQGQLLATDPFARIVAMQFYQGSVKIIPIEFGFGSIAFNVLLPEATVRDMVLLSTGKTPTSSISNSQSSILSSGPKQGNDHISESPILAVLAEDNISNTITPNVNVKLFEVDMKDKVCI
jgi:hypothetical protein